MRCELWCLSLPTCRPSSSRPEVGEVILCCPAAFRGWISHPTARAPRDCPGCSRSYSEKDREPHIVSLRLWRDTSQGHPNLSIPSRTGYDLTSVQWRLLPNLAQSCLHTHLPTHEHFSVLKSPNLNLFPGKVSFISYPPVILTYLFIFKWLGLMDCRLASHLLCPGGLPEEPIMFPLLPEYYFEFM